VFHTKIYVTILQLLVIKWARKVQKFSLKGMKDKDFGENVDTPTFFLGHKNEQLYYAKGKFA